MLKAFQACALGLGRAENRQDGERGVNHDDQTDIKIGLVNAVGAQDVARDYRNEAAAINLRNLVARACRSGDWLEQYRLSRSRPFTCLTQPHGKRGMRHDGQSANLTCSHDGRFHRGSDPSGWGNAAVGQVVNVLSAVEPNPAARG